MKRFTLIAATAVLAILAATNYASARLGIAPLAVSDDTVIQVRGHGHGHARGHRHRGHHYGWHRGRGHWKHHHRRW